MILFAAYTAEETPDAFQWAGQPRTTPKIAPYRGDFDHHLRHGSLGHPSHPKWHLDQFNVQPFLHGSRT